MMDEPAKPVDSDLQLELYKSLRAELVSYVEKVPALDPTNPAYTTLSQLETIFGANGFEWNIGCRLQLSIILVFFSKTESFFRRNR